jgi:hypothetical protein
MQACEVLFFHLVDRMKLPAKIADLGKLLLDRLEPLVPLAVSDLSLRSIRSSKTVFVVQLLNVSNLSAQTRNLFPENLYVIHGTRIPHFDGFHGASEYEQNFRNIGRKPAPEKQISGYGSGGTITIY